MRRIIFQRLSALLLSALCGLCFVPGEVLQSAPRALGLAPPAREAAFVRRSGGYRRTTPWYLLPKTDPRRFNGPRVYPAK